MNTFNQEIHHRRSVRLKNYDYSQPGAYFITVTTYQRALLFGEIIDGKMSLNQCGEIVQSCWERIPCHYPDAVLDSFVIMPNHVHGIIVIADERAEVGLKLDCVGAGLKPAPTKRHPLSEIIRAFKTFSSRRINKIRATYGVPVWQRNYYEHIIRDERELTHIREYISTNYLKWALDNENPARTGISSMDTHR